MFRFLAPRGLFATIFLWFFAAQLLIGAALYGLAAATERQFDRGTIEMAGAYIEARAQATAIAYELGGLEAARRAWRVPGMGTANGPNNRGPRNAAQRDNEPLGGGPLNVRPRDNESPDGRPPDGRPPDGRRPGYDEPRGDGPRDGGPEDRESASLYVARAGAAPQLLVGPAMPLVESQLRSAAQSEESLIEGARGGQWLVRRVTTDKASYLALIRLRGRGGPTRGFLDGFMGGRGTAGGPFWGSLSRWLVIALVMGALCFALARYLTAPALQLSRAARRFAGGDLSVRVGAGLGGRRDELADLGRDFDLMAQSIENQRDAQRQLLGDISHELRSPLARLQVALDLAESGADPQTRGYLGRMEEEVEELGSLIGQLLTLTRLENAEQSVIVRENFDLSRMLADICADADFEASGSGRTVKLLDNQAATLNGNVELLRSAIENVVRNALVHAPNSDVAVSLQTDEAEAIIRVRDWGAGVPEEALADLFRPFYRVASARDRQSGGTGLGLSITQRALASHGGNVAANNAEDGGLQVEMRLPLAPE